MTCKYCGSGLSDTYLMSSSIYRCFQCGYIYKIDYIKGGPIVFEQKGRLSNRFTGRKRRKYLLHRGK